MELQLYEFLYSLSQDHFVTNKTDLGFFNSRSDAYSKVVATTVEYKIIIPQYLGEEKYIKKKECLYLFIQREIKLRDCKENHIKKVSGSILCLKEA